MKHIQTFESFLNEAEFPAQFGIGDDVMWGDGGTGKVAKVSFTAAKVFYDILDDYTGEVVQNVDSAEVKPFGEMFSESLEKGYMTQAELIKFLKSLPEVKIQMPSEYRNGEVFDKNASREYSLSDAIKYISNYKGINGDLSAKIWHIGAEYKIESKLEQKLKIDMQVLDPKGVKRNIAKINKIYLSFDYSDFDKDAHASAVRSMPLD